MENQTDLKYLTSQVARMVDGTGVHGSGCGLTEKHCFILNDDQRIGNVSLLW